MLLAVTFFPPALHGQRSKVRAHAVLVRNTSSKQQQPSQVVLWLEPLSGQLNPYTIPGDAQPARLAQKNKSFVPHLLVVRAGTVVQFPNLDPFFHNVFSLFEGKRFDLGLYEAGSTRSVRFDKPGISYIFCNIHSQMNAIVISVDTPYYAIADRNGNIVIDDLPPGRYILQVWHEGTSPQALRLLRREVSVNRGDTSLGTLKIVEDEVPVAHKNKYARDYDENEPAGSPYSKP